MLMAARYIELNPVHAGMCRKPWRYKWSSAQEHIHGVSRGVLEVDALLQEVEDWECFLLEGMDEEEVDLIDKHTRTGRPLGEASFIEKISRKIGRPLKKKKPGPKGPWKHKK